MKNISFCTVCKNRKEHYIKTIKENINNHKCSGDVEFLLLDYNSTDGLEEWVKSNLIEYIQRGILSYYKTTEPLYFHRSHSRNMAFKLARGNIICNVDADSYIGDSFGEYVENNFAENKRLFICAGGIDDNIPSSDVGGKICFSKSDFLLLEGYDEDMDNYGFEDFDFINRLEMLNITKKIIREPKFLTFIGHEISERISEEFPYKNLMMPYINYINPFASQVLLLFKNTTFAIGTIYNQASLFHKSNSNPTMKGDAQQLSREFSISEGRWLKGKFTENKEELIIYIKDKVYGRMKKVNNNLVGIQNNIETTYYFISNEFLKQELIHSYSMLSNLTKMNWNIQNKVIKVNDGNFGRGTVFKNFDYSNAINIL